MKTGAYAQPVLDNYLLFQKLNQTSDSSDAFAVSLNLICIDLCYPMNRHKGRRHSCPRIRTIEDIQLMMGEAYIMVNAVKYGDDDWVTGDGERFPVKFSARPQIQHISGTPTTILTGYFCETGIQARITLTGADRVENTGLEPTLNHFGF